MKCKVVVSSCCNGTKALSGLYISNGLLNMLKPLFPHSIASPMRVQWFTWYVKTGKSLCPVATGLNHYCSMHTRAEKNKINEGFSLYNGFRQCLYHINTFPFFLNDLLTPSWSQGSRWIVSASPFLSSCTYRVLKDTIGVEAHCSSGSIGHNLQYPTKILRSLP